MVDNRVAGSFANLSAFRSGINLQSGLSHLLGFGAGGEHLQVGIIISIGFQRLAEERENGM